MADDLFNTPADLDSNGELVKLQSFEGQLIILRAKEGDFTTIKVNGEDATYISAEILDVASGVADWKGLWIFPVGVRGQLKRSFPKPVVGVLGKGDASPGKSAPWILKDPTEKQVAAARALFIKAEAGF